jgi:predicted amidophosphoribosyltransferase
MDETIVQNFKDARNAYNRAKYASSVTYREKITEANRKRYVRKTKNCSDCKKRMKLSETVCRWCIETNKKTIAKQADIKRLVAMLPDNDE